MRTFIMRTFVASLMFALPAVAQEPPPPDPLASPETACDNGIDDDGDTVADCADADCKGEMGCKPDGKPENTDERCGDWIDNDGDGSTDCDDAQCTRPNIAACQGSWVGSAEGGGGDPARMAGGGDTLGGGGGFGPDVEMADSNDGVGFVGVRFGVVASVLQSLDFNNTKDEGEYEPALDTRINQLQLRAFGALPLLENSFFLINLRGERSPRLTFAMFQVPLGGGHGFNINTGGGSLSNIFITSVGKIPLLEPAFYLGSAFEQGNGAAVEFQGPLIPGRLKYRAFFGGGAGFSTGNIGGRRFAFDNFNYTYTVGGQLLVSAIGVYNRWDTRYLYRPAQPTLGFEIGAKYDQRQQERYPAVHALTQFRWGIFEIEAQNFVKTELNFGAIQDAYNVLVGVLIIPEHLFLAGDVGQFLTSDFNEIEQLTGGLIDTKEPDVLETELRRQRAETQARVALHWYFWRNNGILSLRYAVRFLDPPRVGADSDRTAQFVSHETWLSAQFRF
jgi:hypothetical protein